ncbi:MAG: hypothetical protein V3U57_06650 [Robiginitomaculum sp.]
MTPLNSKYKGILWVNVLFVASGVGALVYMKFHNLLYAGGAGFGIGLIEYIFMVLSLGHKQAKEEKKNEH